MSRQMILCVRDIEVWHGFVPSLVYYLALVGISFERTDLFTDMLFGTG